MHFVTVSLQYFDSRPHLEPVFQFPVCPHTRLCILTCLSSLVLVWPHWFGVVHWANRKKMEIFTFAQQSQLLSSALIQKRTSRYLFKIKPHTMVIYYCIHFLRSWTVRCNLVNFFRFNKMFIWSGNKCLQPIQILNASWTLELVISITWIYLGNYEWDDICFKTLGNNVFYSNK